MSIKPIDLQTNIAHLHEIAKGEESKASTQIEAKHILEKESREKSKLVNTKLYENKKIERTIIKREEEHKRRNRNRNRDLFDQTDVKKNDKSRVSSDERIGTIGTLIDIKK